MIYIQFRSPQHRIVGPLPGRVLSLVVVCLLSVWPGAELRAGEADLEALPTALVHGCLTCHNGPASSASAVPESETSLLNDFGGDWLSFGRVWGPELAAANSDNDGCENGYELGDPDGDWTAAQGQLTIPVPDQSHPGRAGDCLLPLNQRSWGVLKTLFGE